jgi:hypothetical protein
MKDFLNRDVEVGDSVIIMAPGYRSLVLGRIVALTPKNVRVGYMNTWNYGVDGATKKHCNILCKSLKSMVRI